MPPRLSNLIVATTLSLLTTAGSAQTSTPTLKLKAELYEIPLLVLDRKTKTPVANLQPGQLRFSVDDGPAFSPTFLTPQADAPLSLAILFDVSNSEAGLLGGFKADLAQWAGTALRPQDEVEFYTVGFKIHRATDFIPASSEAVAKALTGMTGSTGAELDPEFKHGGGTRLWDAMYLAVGDLASRPGVRVVLALTDGKDTGGRHRAEELMGYANDNGATLFGLKYNSAATALNTTMSLGMVLLDRRFTPVCEQTGGTVVSANASKRLEALNEVVTLLRTRYIASFPPPPGLKGTDHWATLESATPTLRTVPAWLPLPSSRLPTPAR